MKLTVTLPFVLPSVNHAYKNVSARSRGKSYTRRILTDEARAAMDHAILIIRNQAARQGWRTPERARYRLQIRFYFATDASDGDD